MSQTSAVQARPTEEGLRREEALQSFDLTATLSGSKSRCSKGIMPVSSQLRFTVCKSFCFFFWNLKHDYCNSPASSFFAAMLLFIALLVAKIHPVSFFFL